MTRQPRVPIDLEVYLPSRIKVQIDSRGFQDRHVGWKKIVQTSADRTHRSGNLVYEARNLVLSMHAGIGASTRTHASRATEQLANGLFEDTLHGPTPRLNLPTRELSAVVF